MKALFYTFIFIFSASVSFSSTALVVDSTKSIFEKGLDAIKLQKAKSTLDGGDYEVAHDLYMAMLNNEPNNPFLNYRVGECLLYMKKNADAITYLDKANSLSSEIHKDFKFIYAKALQRVGKFDAAKEQVQTYKAGLKPSQKFEAEESDRLVEEMDYAQTLINNPIKVTITNLGDGVNTKYDEYGPAISADGSLIFFTSRRPETKGGGKDPYDNKFLEDVYSSTYQTETKSWSRSEPVPGKLNTEDHDGCLSLSPNGDELYIYRNEGDAGIGAGDIYVGKRSPSGKWAAAKRFEKPINSSSFESSASITRDGNKMFFISEREKGGLGRADIYMSEKIDKTSWGEPVNLGPSINTKNDESMVFVHPDGDVIFFASNGRKSIGGYDIYKSELKDGKWSEPTNLGFPINTVDDEKNFTMTSDNKRAFITAYKDYGMGGLDIYEVNLSENPLVSFSKRSLFLKGIIIDEDGKPVLGASVSLKNLENNETLTEVKTDNTGAFKLMVKPNGKYRYSVVKSGFITSESNDIFVSETDTEVIKDFVLKRK